MSKGLPIVITQSEGQVNDFLYFAIAHEFGHIFDFANDLNKIKSECLAQKLEGKTEDCEMADGSWGSISWLTESKARPENDFPNRSSLCFYSCNNNFIQSPNINKLYSDLYFSEFISIYSTIQPWDDFADSLAYYLVDKNLNTKYIIDTQQGITFDIMMKLKSSTWNRKSNYIKNFLESADIIYP
jgi:hypothetical protein